MASFFAAATHFFTGGREAAVTWKPSPTPSLSSSHEDRIGCSDPGPRQPLQLSPEVVLDIRRQSLPASISCAALPRPSVPVIDVPVHPNADPPTSAQMNSVFFPEPLDATNSESTCSSPHCDHSYCFPPRLVYSPASSSSIALETPSLTTPIDTDADLVVLPTDRKLLSPTGFALSDISPNGFLSPGQTKPKSTLAERRGVKALALPDASAASPGAHPKEHPDTPKSRLLSPRTPDSASSFTQRLVGFMRPGTPTTSSFTPRSASLTDDTPQREYYEDPFGRAAPPFHDDQYLFDGTTVRPHPDLFDLTVYQPRPRGAPKSTLSSKKGIGRMKLRLFVDPVTLVPECASVRVSRPRPVVTPIPNVSATDAGTTSAGVGTDPRVLLHSTPPASASSSADRPIAPAAPILHPSPPSLPIPASLTPVHAVAHVHTHARGLGLGLGIGLSPPVHPTPVPVKRSERIIVPAPLASPHLRPLLLPQKFAPRREIADVSVASILPPAAAAAGAPKLRPLLLPQELARRRASHDSRTTLAWTPQARSPFVQRASFPRPQLRPRPATCPSILALSSHRRAFSHPINTGAMAVTFRPGDISSTTSTSTVASGTQDREDQRGSWVAGGEEEERGAARGEQRRSQQLDDIICLLNQSGILEEPRDADSDELPSPSPTHARSASPASSTSDSDESAGVATPPSAISRRGSESSVSFVSESYDADAETDTDAADEVSEKTTAMSQRDSQNLEDILKLLGGRDDGEPAAGVTDACDEQEEAETSLCAYAM